MKDSNITNAITILSGWMDSQSDAERSLWDYEWRRYEQHEKALTPLDGSTFPDWAKTAPRRSEE